MSYTVKRDWCKVHELSVNLSRYGKLEQTQSFDKLSRRSRQFPLTTIMIQTTNTSNLVRVSFVNYIQYIYPSNLSISRHSHFSTSYVIYLLFSKKYSVTKDIRLHMIAYSQIDLFQKRTIDNFFQSKQKFIFIFH